MQHLNDEVLARLADSTPNALEASHLDVCEQCRERRRELQANIELLHALPRRAPTSSEWSRVTTTVHRRRRVRQLFNGASLVAAAAVLFIAGVGVGARRSSPRHASSLVSTSGVSVAQATARLAAFEAALLTTREAASHAPRDSILVAYERLTLAARDSLLSVVRLTSRKQWY